MATNNINFINYVVAECIVGSHMYVKSARFEECAPTVGVTSKLPREVYAEAYSAFKGTWSVGAEAPSYNFDYTVHELTDAFSVKTGGKYKMTPVYHQEKAGAGGETHHRVLFEVASTQEGAVS